MPGRGIYIPSRCVDAGGQERPLFNPAVRRNEPPDGFSPSEWQAITNRLGEGRADHSGTLGVLAIGAAFSVVAGGLIVASGLPWWWSFLGFLPPAGCVVLCLLLRHVAERTWGVVAFTEMPDDLVADALLSAGRCPSCGYPLDPRPTPEIASTCAECGGHWRSRGA